MPTFDFKQVDVFASEPLKGNPLAVVIAADGLPDDRMAAFARWTNLSETIFLLRPTTPRADYRVRIFTPGGELPFAGHPTLGACAVWLASGGRARGDTIVQECPAGLITLRLDGSRMAFAAPPLVRSGPVEPDLLPRIAAGLGLAVGEIREARWVDNGPGWLAVLLGTRRRVLALRPDPAVLGDLKVGVVAPWDPVVDGPQAQFEVRAFVPGLGIPEDPVTGSLNAGVAQWLIGAGLAPESYVASQGTALGRAGRVHIGKSGADIWVGGEVVTCIEGTVTL
ncbi:PhzF family phenazine biosynthesis protein [Castellaniella denitrificans]|jgi:PhzF family phenazine biosynthesis protein|uniref:PhzF family phenazine biosynthesis protein n=1 Tax=Castellaniella denitrificans TaxID=56119 RepID=A0ABT4M1J4_9BURK|nr:PhzF family phenazine biosynthesis protein [Castellaniella denitrificans]MCZ4329184.1 PhzF family phenazine biosynthesis protein [Castellaniella denitrificans]